MKPETSDEVKLDQLIRDATQKVKPKSKSNQNQKKTNNSSDVLAFLRRKHSKALDQVVQEMSSASSNLDLNENSCVKALDNSMRVDALIGINRKKVVQADLATSTLRHHTSTSTGGSYREHGMEVFRRYPKQYPFAQAPLPDEDLVEEIESMVEGLPGLPDLLTSKDSNNSEDPVRNWQIMCLKSTIDKINFDWSSHSVKGMIEDFLNVVPALDGSDLQTCVQHLSMIKRYKIQPDILKKIILALDERSTKWLCETVEDSVKSGRDLGEEKHSILRLCYLWFKAGLVTADEWNKENELVYLKEVLKVLVNNHKVWKSLNPNEFIFTMFMIGLHRRIPLQNDEPSLGEDKTRIPIQIETKLRQVMSSLSVDEVGIICEVFHMTNFKLKNVNQHLIRGIFEAMLSVPPKDIMRSDPAIASMAKILQDRCKYNPGYMSEVDEKFKQYFPYLKPMTNARLLHLMQSNASAEFVKNFASSMRGRLKELRLKDITRLAFSLHYLNYKDQTPSNGGKNIYALLLDAADSCDLSHISTGRQLVYLNNFVAKAGEVREANLNDIFSIFNNSDRLANAMTTDDIFNAGIEILYGFRKPVRNTMSKLNQKAKRREETFARMLNMNCLVAVAELDCLLEILHPGYKGERLALSTRQRLLHLTEVGSSSSHYKVFRSFIRDELIKIVGQKRVFYGPILPHATFYDILVDLGNDIDDDFREEFKARRHVVKAPSARAHVLLVPKFGLQCFGMGGQPCGTVKLKAEQLKKLGYKVRIWQEFSANEWLQGQKQLQFQPLENLLFDNSVSDGL